MQVRRETKEGSVTSLFPAVGPVSREGTEGERPVEAEEVLQALPCPASHTY